METDGVRQDTGVAQGTISLLTDFGHADGYVGILKGVILGIHPGARIVDLCHEVTPQGIREAAYILMSSVGVFPPGTVHLAVVDPGVGSGRRALAARSGNARFVAPDNGILSWALGADAQVVVLDREELFRHPVSATFHGRDIFAPVAAHLSRGMPLERVGTRVSEWRTIPPPRCEMEGPTVRGEVLHVDRFGNVITSIPGARVRGDAGTVRIEVGRLEARVLRSTYADGVSAETIVYEGSSGYLEVARVGGSASLEAGAKAGDPVTLRMETSTGEKAR